MNLDYYFAWGILLIAAALQLWYMVSEAHRTNVRRQQAAFDRQWATVPRDTFYDTLRAEYDDAERFIDWPAFEAELRNGPTS